VLAAIARVSACGGARGALIESSGAEAAGRQCDNLEQLAAAAADVAMLLATVADLDILATSRAPLRLSGEHVVPLAPLPVEDATMLFFELAASQGVPLGDESLPAVHEICRRLDGLPLAIELVAARLVLLPPTQLLAALDEGLALEMEGPVDLPARQRTLHATLDELRAPEQRQRGSTDCCRWLAAARSRTPGRGQVARRVLADPEASRRSCCGDAATAVRLSMLETVRETPSLASPLHAGRRRRRHAERLALRRGRGGLAGPEQAGWLERSERELDNMRAALDWCLTNGGREALQRCPHSAASGVLTVTSPGPPPARRGLGQAGSRSRFAPALSDGRPRRWRIGSVRPSRRSRSAGDLP
jgi:hypothetical protein